MKFEPVYLPDPLGDRASMTMLRHYAQCPRSGYLYVTEGGVQTREMVRGSAFHLIAERATRLMIDQGEETIPPEVAKVLTDEVLAEMPVVFEDHDLVREMAYRWAEQTAVDPNAVIACETLFVIDVDGFQVRCKVDHAELRDEGRTCLVRDYKTSRHAPALDDVSRTRPDGTLSAKSFQLVLYALALRFGHPVVVETCPVCDGRGMLGPEPRVSHGYVDPQTDDRETCEGCDGRGVVETPEPFRVASACERFDVEFVYPALENKDGQIITRPMSLTRLELEEYMGSLRGLVARLRASDKTGDFPAVVSAQACSECPAAHRCPIPVQQKRLAGALNEETAPDFLAAWWRAKEEVGKAGRAARSFVKEHGPTRFDGMVAEIGQRESEEIPDKQAMWEAQERAVRFGEPFDRERFIRRRQSFPLVVRPVTDEDEAA